MNVLLLGFLILGIQITGTTGLWGNLQMSFQPNPKANLNVICKRTQSVLQGSTNFCSSKPELVKTVLKGIVLAVKECQNKFASRKWNCSTVKRSIRKILQSDYRETAFVFAITSAGITFSVSKACSEGDLEGCNCRANQVVGDSNNLVSKDDLYNKRSIDRQEYERKGCQLNFIEFGYQIAKRFMDQGNNRDAKALVTRHNNEAGRLAVKNHMHFRCRCHGLSEICTVKTCWPELAPFHSTSDRIKTHFDGAIKVYADNKGERLIAEEPTVKPPTSEDLVYTTKSPDFCNVERETGSLGTKGRKCNVTSMGTGGCDLLCCSRGHEAKNVVEYVNCECTFHWCCDVRCKTCRQERTVYTCL